MILFELWIYSDNRYNQLLGRRATPDEPVRVNCIDCDYVTDDLPFVDLIIRSNAPDFQPTL